jgi:DNA-binding CsgD family transcriptional regulator
MNAVRRLLNRLLGRVAGHGPAISPQRLQQLTRRERQVAALVCLRFTNRQIARQLRISPYTVRPHVRTALGKLDCRAEPHCASALRRTVCTVATVPACVLSWGCTRVTAPNRLSSDGRGVRRGE